MIDTITISRKENGEIFKIEGIQHLEKLLNEYKKEELPNAESPYHHEAEIASGLKYLILWVKNKNYHI